MDLSKRILSGALIVMTGATLFLLAPRLHGIALIGTHTATPSDQEVADQHLMDALKNKLIDPDSLKLRNVKHYHQKVSDTQMMYSTCGEVNSKNSYGGYVGYTAFASSALVTDSKAGPYFFDGTTAVFLDGEAHHTGYIMLEKQYCTDTISSQK